VIGAVEGKGVNKDWGIAGEVEFKYMYHLNYTSDVVSNDGYRIRELRSFDTVEETMLISKYHFHLDLREDFEPIRNMIIQVGETMHFAGTVGECLPDPNCQFIGKIVKNNGKMIRKGVLLVDMGLAVAEKVTLNKQQVEWMFNKLGQTPGAEKIVTKLRERIAKPNLGRVLGYTPALKLLEGKQFELEYEDGIGLVKVDVADKNQIINSRERELLERAFYLSDYYIFRDSDRPRRRLEIGDSWQVDARTIAGVLDPRLRHEAKGRITLSRADNKQYDNKDMAAFKLERGKVQMVPPNGPQKIEGEVAFTSGEILYDLELNYVAKSFFSGSAKYREVSTDHMFFGARLASEPHVSIRYECKATSK
jgi:hypothetical protein